MSGEQSHGDTARESRREFVKKAAYIAPVVMTLPVTLGAARVGSGAPSCPFGGEFPNCDS
jgi:hypothetical protein